MISTCETSNYYAFFYFLAFALAFVLKLHEGKKRNFPWVCWIALNIFALTLFVIGTKVLTVPKADWIQLFTHFRMPEVHERTVLGGLLFFLLVIIVARSWFGFKNEFLDASAIPSIIGITIQRLGCLLGGCCFGTPTSLPWGISYDKDSPAYIYEVNHGMIFPEAKSSLLLHPAQLYYVVAGTLIIIAIFFVRKKLKTPGTLFALSLCLYSFSRFIIEFFVAGNQIGNASIFGLKSVQWVLLLMVAGTLIWFINLQRKPITQTLPPQEQARKSIILVLISFGLIILLKSWFSVMELHLLQILGLISLILIGVHHYQMVYRMQLRYLHLALFAVFILASSQTLIKPDRDSLYTWYNSISADETLGKYQGASREICGSYYYENRIAATRLDYNNVRVRNDNPFRYRELGLQVQFIGATQNPLIRNYQEYDTLKTKGGNSSESYMGLVPYAAFNYKWVGFSTGFVYSSADLINKDTHILPLLSFRLGREDYFYMRAKGFDNPLTNLELPMGSISFGTGFGQLRSNFLEIGYGYSDFASNVWLFSGGYKTSDKLKLTGSFIYGNSHNLSLGFGFKYSLK